jgi:hypothetical protein
VNVQEPEFPLTDYELGWLVGILEGEGYFGYTGTQRVKVKMCDKDSILRLNALYTKIFGVEFHISQECPQKDYHNETYGIYLHGTNARYIMKSIVRHMSYRRRQQIYRALNGWVCPKLDLKLLMGGKK